MLPSKRTPHNLLHSEGMSHSFGFHPGIKFFGGDVAEFQGGILQADFFAVGGEGNLRSFFVANVGVQSGDEHQAIVEIGLNPGGVGFDAHSAEIIKRLTAIGQQLHRLQHVVEHDRFEDIELKVALRSGKGHGVIVAKDLDCNHRQGFALGGVDFSGHDGGAGFIFGNFDFANARAGARGIPADIVGNFHQGSSQGAESGAEVHHAIVGGKGGKFVGGRNKRIASFGGNFLGGNFAKAGMGVEAGANGSAPDRQFIDSGSGATNRGDRVI